MRIVFFVLVLVVGARFMLTTVPAAVRAVPAELYDGAGLFGLLVDDRGVALTMVEVLRVPVVLAIALSAVGLGGRLPMLVAGLGSFLMVGAYLSGTGTGHSWYVAIVAMVVLGLTHQPTAWSLDGVLARRWRRYPFGRGERDTERRRAEADPHLRRLHAVRRWLRQVARGGLALDGRRIDPLLPHSRTARPRAPSAARSPSSSSTTSWVAVAISVLAVVVELGARADAVRPWSAAASTSSSSPPGSTSPPTC